jgi:hypothetical protein
MQERNSRPWQFIPVYGVDSEMRRLLPYLFVLAALCSLHAALPAQYQLVLENPGAFKRKHIQVGDEIGIRVKGMDQLYVGDLQKVKAEMIYIFGDSLSPDSLDRIHLAKPRAGINMLRGALIMAAIIYPVMMIINLPHDQWTWKKGAKLAAAAAAALITQKLMKRGYWKRYKLGKGKWELRIMPTVESLEVPGQ